MFALQFGQSLQFSFEMNLKSKRFERAVFVACSGSRLYHLNPSYADVDSGPGTTACPFPRREMEAFHTEDWSQMITECSTSNMADATEFT